MQLNELLKPLQKTEELFDGTFGTWKENPVDFEFKEGAKPICSRTHPVRKVHTLFFLNDLNV